MKSIKPGRGPSRQNMVGSIAAALFGVFWCIMAASMGAVFMVPFGLIFIGISIYNGVYSYHNATSEDRYSIVDIVSDDEESDPLNDRYGRKKNQNYIDDYKASVAESYCPYCGKPVDPDFEFCPKCGKKLPE